MTDVEIMIKALRLAWIPWLLTPEMRNWKAIPGYYLNKTGGLNFLLRCNYDAKYIDGLPLFYKDILTFFTELKNLYSYDSMQDLVLFNNKEILVGGRPVFIKEWFDSNILNIRDLLNSNGQLLSFQEFNDKIFVNNVIDWFYATNNSKFAPTIEEKLFGITSGPYEKGILKKFNYTILFMKYYIYTSKMHNEALILSVFVDKVLSKYRIESFGQ